MYDMFIDVAWLKGDFNTNADLHTAGATTAESILCICGPPEGNEPRLADATGIMLSASLEIMLKEAGRDAFAMYEFQYPDNACVLDDTPVCAMQTEGFYEQSKLPGIERAHEENCQIMQDNLKRPVHMLPRYAGGRVFIRSQLGALYAQAYRTPGILELAEALVMPSRRGQVSYPWLIEIPSDFDGRPYGDLVQACLTDGLQLSVDRNQGRNPILPVGLFRGEDSGLGIRYVFSNPPPETLVMPSDKMYVFASEAWGHAYTSRGKALASFPWAEWGEMVKGTARTGCLPPSMSSNDSFQLAKATEEALVPGLKHNDLSPMLNGTDNNLPATCTSDDSNLSLLHPSDEQMAPTDGGEQMAPSNSAVHLKAPLPESEVQPTLSEANKIIDTIFERYDTDRSGTLNSIEEVRMLTVNTCFKLGIRAPPPDVEVEVETVWESNQEMDVGQYRSWFHTVHGRLLQNSA